MSDEEVLPLPRQPQPPVVPMASAQCAEVWTALALAQGKFSAPQRTKEAAIKGQTKDGRVYEYKYKYAPLEEIEHAIKEPMADNQLYRQQYLVSRGEQWFIRTIVGHSSGQWVGCDYPVFAGDNRNHAQSFASGVTYARRYGLSLLLGLCPEDDDDAQATDVVVNEKTAPPAKRKLDAADRAEIKAYYDTVKDFLEGEPSLEEVRLYGLHADAEKAELLKERFPASYARLERLEAALPTLSSKP